jgi:hypothetical protein
VDHQKDFWLPLVVGTVAYRTVGRRERETDWTVLWIGLGVGWVRETDWTVLWIGLGVSWVVGWLGPTVGWPDPMAGPDKPSVS